MPDQPVNIERAWFRVHPDPQESAFGDSLSLWNYAIGGADLASAHQAAIRNFLGVGPLGPPNTFAEMNVRGHASLTGEGTDNARLSAARADKVAAYIYTLGIKMVNPSSAGSGEPEDPAPLGGAYARNRRVDVRRFYPSPTEGTKPISTVQLKGPDAAKATTPDTPRNGTEPGLFSSSGFEITSLPIRLWSSTTTPVTYAVSWEVTGRGTFKGPRGGVEAAAAWTPEQRTAKLAVPLGEQLMAKAQARPGAGAQPASMSAGVQLIKLDPSPGSGIEGRVEFGFQLRPNFVYLSGSLGNQVIECAVGDGVKAVIAAEIKLKIECGLSSEFIRALLRLSLAVATQVLEALEAGAAQLANRLAGGAAEKVALEEAVEAILVRLSGGLGVGAALVGWFSAGAALAVGFSAGFAAVVNSCVAEGEARTHIYAQRAGAAGRLTVEIFDADKTTVIAHAQRRADYLRLAGGSNTQANFVAGDDLVRKQIDALKAADAYDDHHRRWVDTYAKNANITDYDSVSAAVFKDLGGIATAQRDLQADVQTF
jgi:hypothetical protein